MTVDTNLNDTEQVNQIQNDIVETQHVSDKEINFRALEDKSRALEAQNQMMQVRLMEIEKSQQKQQQPQYADDDIPTWGELKRAREAELNEVRLLKEQIKDLRMRTNHNDYESTIKEYLPDVLQENPDLAMAIKDNPLMHELAYKLAQSSPRYHQERLAKSNQATVNKIVENTTRVQPANARKNISIQDEDMRMSSMSDDQLMALHNMAKARS